MMDEEQVEVVKMVYSRFINSEEEIWTDLDENLEIFDYLNDKELVTESQVKFTKHSKGAMRCKQDHDYAFCMAPYILDSVAAIVDLYEKTDELHIKNRYILLYYCALSELGLIYSE